MVGSNDQRPLVRRLGTRVYNQLLRTACGYKGTDTHGLKAFKRAALVETAQRCVLDRDVFASEFVIRAHREKKKVVEIPFAVREKRPPSINLIKRVPHVLKSVARLADLGPRPGLRRAAVSRAGSIRRPGLDDVVLDRAVGPAAVAADGVDVRAPAAARPCARVRPASAG